MAKLGIVLLTLFVPQRARTIIYDWLPLPDMVYGYIFVGASQPDDGERIWVLSEDGEDITSGNWYADSEGFFIVKARRKMKRSDVLLVMPAACKREMRIPLAKSNQVALDPRSIPGRNKGLNPLFVYHVLCSEK